MKDNKITPDGDEGKPPDMPLPIPVSYIVDGGEWVRDFSCACHVITKPESIWCVEAMKFIEYLLDPSRLNDDDPIAGFINVDMMFAV